MRLNKDISYKLIMRGGPNRGPKQIPMIFVCLRSSGSSCAVASILAGRPITLEVSIVFFRAFVNSVDPDGGPCVVLWRPDSLDCRVLIRPETWSGLTRNPPSLGFEPQTSCN